MKKTTIKKPLTAYSEDGTPVMEIFSIHREGNRLVMDGKALEVMRMNIIVPIDEVTNGIGIILNRHVFIFALKLPGAIIRNWVQKLLNRRSSEQSPEDENW